MSLRVQVLCAPAVAAGFRLAGFTPIEVTDPAGGMPEVRAALRRPDLGVLLVEAPIYEALGEVDRRAISRHPLPMVVPFPGPSWAEAVPPEEFIADLLRQAIGYRVRLA